jgi:hypothetical protein
VISHTYHPEPMCKIYQAYRSYFKCPTQQKNYFAYLEWLFAKTGFMKIDILPINFTSLLNIIA